MENTLLKEIRWAIAEFNLMTLSMREFNKPSTKASNQFCDIFESAVIALYRVRSQQKRGSRLEAVYCGEVVLKLKKELHNFLLELNYNNQLIQLTESNYYYYLERIDRILYVLSSCFDRQLKSTFNV
ncbi:MAG: hypothetical protein AAF349_12705, partial [Cyanobacteria bacterium P01_A01_bin.68]